MRKVVLTMSEDFAYQEVKRYVEQRGNLNPLCIKVVAFPTKTTITDFLTTMALRRT